MEQNQEWSSCPGGGGLDGGCGQPHTSTLLHRSATESLPTIAGHHREGTARVREVTEAEERRVNEQVEKWIERVMQDYVRAMTAGDGAVLLIGQRRFVVRDGELRPAD